MLRQVSIFCFLLLSTSFNDSAADEVKILESEVYETPFITEEVSLNQTFELYITKGAKVFLLDGKQRLDITLNKMTVLCVQVEGECLGEQFAFDFSATMQKQSKNFRLTLNEPQNMDLSELDIEDSEKSLFSEYNIAVHGMNFSVSKNSITLQISK
jgi:hypothetical protein